MTNHNDEIVSASKSMLVAEAEALASLRADIGIDGLKELRLPLEPPYLTRVALMDGTIMRGLVALVRRSGGFVVRKYKRDRVQGTSKRCNG